MPQTTQNQQVISYARAAAAVLHKRFPTDMTVNFCRSTAHEKPANTASLSSMHSRAPGRCQHIRSRGGSSSSKVGRRIPASPAASAAPAIG